MNPFQTKSLSPVALILGFIVLAFSVTTQSSETSIQVTPRIVGGEPTEPGEWPNIGFILLQGEEPTNERLICVASLIAPKWALTAAHCFVFPNSQLLPIREASVVFGHNDLTDPVSYTQLTLPTKA